MFSTALRTFGAVVTRNATRQIPRVPAVRAFSVIGPCFGDVGPNFFGSGAKPGTVPTDAEQATGLERLELLAALEGKELFEMKPLSITKYGTKKDPIMVKSVDPIRYVGWFPVDSHELLWITVDKSHEFDRCPECGQVFKINFVGTESHGHGHDPRQGSQVGETQRETSVEATGGRAVDLPPNHPLKSWHAIKYLIPPHTYLRAKEDFDVLLNFNFKFDPPKGVESWIDNIWDNDIEGITRPDLRGVDEYFFKI
ncbi:3026_t:CDS:2, partial [Racocetra fulgida]